MSEYASSVVVAFKSGQIARKRIGQSKALYSRYSRSRFLAEKKKKCVVVWKMRADGEFYSKNGRTRVACKIAMISNFSDGLALKWFARYLACSQWWTGNVVNSVAYLFKSSNAPYQLTSGPGTLDYPCTLWCIERSLSRGNQWRHDWSREVKIQTEVGTARALSLPFKSKPTLMNNWYNLLFKTARSSSSFNVKVCSIGANSELAQRMVVVESYSETYDTNVRTGQARQQFLRRVLDYGGISSL